MKVYGRKNEEQNLESVLVDIRILQRTVNRLRNYDLVPKGIFRFANFAEADEWMIQKIVENHVPHNLKT
jgi:hypothetical protein